MAISKFEIHQQQIADIEYHYLDEGSGPALIFLHGFPDLASTWDTAIADLSKDYRCIAPFLRGYYPTGLAADDDYSIKSIATDVVQLAEALKLDSFCVIGQDWGASITYSVASLAADRIPKIATVAIPHVSCIKPSLPLLYFARHFWLFRNKEKAVKKTRKNNYAYLDTLYKRWSPDWTNYQETSNLMKEHYSKPGYLEAAISYYISFFADRKDPEKQSFYYKKPTMPVLFMGGKNDQGVNNSMVEMMNRKMPEGSRTVLFDNSGHFLHQEVPEAFVKELMAFL